MKYLIYFTIFLILAVLLGLAIYTDPGYTLLAYHHWTLEMPLWATLLILIILFFVLHYSIRFIHYLTSIRRRLHIWKEERHLNRSLSFTEKGLLEIAEGRWEVAEDLLIKGVKKSRIPIINYLNAARAAQALTAYDRRDEYLNEAYNCAPQYEDAISLTKAQLLLDQEQFELARSALIQLEKSIPNHEYLLQLLKKLYLRTKDWKPLLTLLPKLKKNKLIDEHAFFELELKAAQHLLDQLVGDNEATKKLWKKMPSQLQRSPKLLYPYCQTLLLAKEYSLATKLLSDALNHEWSDRLCELYGSIKSTQPEKLLTQGEKWLKHQKQNPILLLALGKLAIQLKHWAKAEEYINLSLKQRGTADTYHILGLLYQETKQPDKALWAYRQAAKLQQF